jgi:hypothetical protein
MNAEDFSRVADMSERELMAWHFVFARMAAFYDRLADLEAGLTLGRRPPDPDLLAAQEAIRAELEKRTLAKGAP